MTLLPTNHPLGGGGFGLFGAPKFGKKRFPDFEPMPSPQMPQANQPKEQDWMSGGKMTGRDAAGLALLAIGDAFGRKGSNNLGNMLQNRMAMQQQERMAQQQREQGWQDWQRKFDYTQANKAPETPTPTTMQRDYEYIRATQGEEAAKTYIGNKINPPVWRQGSDGQFYRVDTAGGQMPPDTLPADFDFGGGSGGNAAGGFRP